MTLRDLREWLGVLAEADASLPARVVLERLPVSTNRAGDDLAALNVHQAGKLLGRSPSTVRAYAREGLLPGSFRQRGREWKIPADAIRKFQAAEAKPKATTVTRSGSSDLGAWRSEIDATQPSQPTKKD